MHHLIQAILERGGNDILGHKWLGSTVFYFKKSAKTSYPLFVRRFELGRLQQHECVSASHEHWSWRNYVRLHVVLDGNIQHVVCVQLLLFRFKLPYQPQWFLDRRHRVNVKLPYNNRFNRTTHVSQQKKTVKLLADKHQSISQSSVNIQSK